MAYVISDDCVACGTCIDECPVGAISEGEKYSFSNEGLFVYSLWKPVFISIVPKKRAFLP